MIDVSLLSDIDDIGPSSSRGDVVLGHKHTTYSVETILERLNAFEYQLDQEGRYTDANIVWLAASCIDNLRKAK